MNKYDEFIFKQAVIVAAAKITVNIFHICLLCKVLISRLVKGELSNSLLTNDKRRKEC